MDQFPGKWYPIFRPKLFDFYTLSQTKLFDFHTFQSGTYLYSSFQEYPRPPFGEFRSLDSKITLVCR